MLYASTKATFKKQFGASQIKDEYYANTKEEITLAGYRKHLAVDAAPGPLTRQEEEMKEIKETESRVEISVETKHNTLSALSFPFQREASSALEKYSGGTWDYVQLAIGQLSQGWSRAQSNLHSYRPTVRVRHPGRLQVSDYLRADHRGARGQRQVPRLPVQTLPRERLPGEEW